MMEAHMYSAGQLTVSAALLYAPYDTLATLKGVILRDISVNRNLIQDPAISDDAWRRYADDAEQMMEFRIEGIVHHHTGMDYIRMAALSGEKVRLEIRWPGAHVSDGLFIVSAYRELTEPDSLLEYRATLVSSGAQMMSAPV
jgi:predicted secreted protein